MITLACMNFVTTTRTSESWVRKVRLLCLPLVFSWLIFGCAPEELNIADGVRDSDVVVLCRVETNTGFVVHRIEKVIATRLSEDAVATNSIVPGPSFRARADTHYGNNALSFLKKDASGPASSCDGPRLHQRSITFPRNIVSRSNARGDNPVSTSKRARIASHLATMSC